METRAPRLISVARGPVVIAALAAQPGWVTRPLLDSRRGVFAPARAFSVPDEDVGRRTPHFGGGSESSEDDEEVAGSGGGDDAEDDDVACSLTRLPQLLGGRARRLLREERRRRVLLETLLRRPTPRAFWGVRSSNRRKMASTGVAHGTLLSLLQARTEGFAEAVSSAAKEAGGDGPGRTAALTGAAACAQHAAAVGDAGSRSRASRRISRPLIRAPWPTSNARTTQARSAWRREYHAVLFVAATPASRPARGGSVTLRRTRAWINCRPVARLR